MTMTYDHDVDTQDADMPTPQRPAKAGRPSIHLDPIHGRFIANEARTHLECLRSEHAEALGDTRRHLGDRIWLWTMLVDQLEGFHGIEAS